MSAFICDTDHIKALATFAVSGIGSEPINQHWFGYLPADQRAELTLNDFGDRRARAEEIANILYGENVRSVSVRYREAPRYANGVSVDHLPGLIERPEVIGISDADVFHPLVRDPVAILKMCDCFEYQARETDDWPETLARRVLDAIRRGAIHHLPGYDDAPWEFSG